MTPLKNLSILLSSVALLLLGTYSHAAPLTIEYTFGTDVATTLAPVDANPVTGITVSDVSSGSGANSVLSVNPSTDSPDNMGYNLTSPMISIGAATANVNTLSSAITNNVYISFTITPDVGTTFSLENISFLAGKSANSSQREWGLFSEPTGFTAAGDAIASSVVDETRGDGSMESFDVALNGVTELQNISTATEIRFYIDPGTDGTNRPGRRVDLDSIVLTGTAIPEPQTIFLVLLSGGLCVFVRQYRKRKQ